MRMAYNEDDAWKMIDQLEVCGNCKHCKSFDLFDTHCELKTTNVKVELNQSCTLFGTSFSPHNKHLKYWIDKLVEMAQEYHGSNDFHRQLTYQQSIGKDLDFINNRP